MPPEVALRGFLTALGVEPSAVPLDVDVQAALYRSLLADKRMLVVLDNAADSAQVIPLLPAGPSFVLITSRRQHLGLLGTHGGHSLHLDVLPPDQALRLLIRHLGRPRVEAEPGAAAEILDAAAGLPLALAIMAARAALHPDFPLEAGGPGHSREITRARSNTPPSHCPSTRR